ncbi:hypothetical protein CMI37_25595 [Candidatus Pacearchaeota archaeon]|nr:hypothetical protein [Candidatus Pacearchaeota archaeon]|tara:strand:+ start:207 stop:416 length:210 start_codon:yes stop_codon:yes gene_type:complete
MGEFKKVWQFVQDEDYFGLLKFFEHKGIKNPGRRAIEYIEEHKRDIEFAMKEQSYENWINDIEGSKQLK